MFYQRGRVMAYSLKWTPLSIQANNKWYVDLDALLDNTQSLDTLHNLTPSLHLIRSLMVKSNDFPYMTYYQCSVVTYARTLFTFKWPWTWPPHVAQCQMLFNTIWPIWHNFLLVFSSIYMSEFSSFTSLRDAILQNLSDFNFSPLSATQDQM